MADVIIKTEGLVKDYGHQRGIFDLDLSIKKGEVYGYVGTNGSGKTTTIRNMMGFIKPDAGKVTVLGMDAWEDAVEIKKHVSYVPGEISFPAVGKGTDFLKLQAEYLGTKDYSYMNRLVSMLQLDPSANLKRMSKGMKQKTALVAALMGDKDILILDEPTTGLDPLMRETFLDLIREEKAKGKTIFMSSHIFEEIEDVCDRVSMIKDGYLLGTVDLAEYRRAPIRRYQIRFADGKTLAAFLEDAKGERAIAAEILAEEEQVCQVSFPAEEMGRFLGLVGRYQVKKLQEQRKTLQETFTEIYNRGATGK